MLRFLKKVLHLIFLLTLIFTISVEAFTLKANAYNLIDPSIWQEADFYILLAEGKNSGNAVNYAGMHSFVNIKKKRVFLRFMVTLDKLKSQTDVPAIIINLNGTYAATIYCDNNVLVEENQYGFEGNCQKISYNSDTEDYLYEMILTFKDSMPDSIDLGAYFTDSKGVKSNSILQRIFTRTTSPATSATTTKAVQKTEKTTKVTISQPQSTSAPINHEKITSAATQSQTRASSWQQAQPTTQSSIQAEPSEQENLSNIEQTTQVFASNTNQSLKIKRILGTSVAVILLIIAALLVVMQGFGNKKSQEKIEIEIQKNEDDF